MNPGQPPSAEAGRQQIRGEPGPIPGQLTLPGMPSPAEAGRGQATLPGLEFPAADGTTTAGRFADDRAADDRDLAAVAAELRALDAKRHGHSSQDRHPRHQQRAASRDTNGMLIQILVMLFLWRVPPNPSRMLLPERVLGCSPQPPNPAGRKRGDSM